MGTLRSLPAVGAVDWQPFAPIGAQHAGHVGVPGAVPGRCGVGRRVVPLPACSGAERSMPGVVVRRAGARRAPERVAGNSVSWECLFVPLATALASLRDVGELRPRAVERSSLGQGQGEPCVCRLPQVGALRLNRCISWVGRDL